MRSRACPHCKARSHFTDQWQGYVQPPLEAAQHPEILRFCQTCDNCEMPVCGATLDGNDPDDAPVWPRDTGRRKFPDVPDATAASASEAHLALGAGAPRASVAMARATVEATAKERGITKGDLRSKIDKLAEADHISEAMRLAAHEIRFAGNEVAHADPVEEPIDLGEAQEIVNLMDAILERVYQEPARVARIRASRERKAKRPAEQEPSVIA